MTVTHINPDTLFESPVFSQGTLVNGVLYIGGQNGTDVTGAIPSDLAEQSAQATRNLIDVVQAAGGSIEDIVKLNIYLVEGQDLQTAFEAAMRVWGTHRTAVTGLIVAGLARPEALIELDGIASIG